MRTSSDFNFNGEQRNRAAMEVKRADAAGGPRLSLLPFDGHRTVPLSAATDQIGAFRHASIADIKLGIGASCSPFYFRKGWRNSLRMARGESYGAGYLHNNGGEACFGESKGFLSICVRLSQDVVGQRFPNFLAPSVTRTGSRVSNLDLNETFAGC
ncbi:hypothetical protein Trydic_g14934 [Trypoxylus dichotomus]